jgi:RNA polymerase sigma-70 factor (ECF subfamily)
VVNANERCVIDLTATPHHWTVQCYERSCVTSMAYPAVLPDAERQARLGRMVARDYRMIWRLLRRWGVREHAVDDATQQVFLVAAERLADIAPQSERSFLFGTALRVSRSVHRKHSREEPSADTDLSASSLPGPDELSEQRRARERLDRILEQLPFDLRTVFVLFELEGLSSPEIAELIGAPLGTVASRLRRARERFGVLVSEESASRALRQGPR